ncbi:GGDEF domain-containing protein [Shewanella xiamenensis]|uniref:GGDEF domain-containing protein n=1 Tax=Shewanella xiamenensis TaxID=332186 RepID=UPI0035B7A1A5
MFNLDDISRAFVENFPGLLSIRDENHKIVFLNDSFKLWINSLINTIPIGMTNDDIVNLLTNQEIINTFKQCHDLSLSYINNNETNNKIISFYDVNLQSEIFYHVTKFKSLINGRNYIFTTSIDITKSYLEMLEFKNKSFLDPLTNAYNRNILSTLSLKKDDLLIYIDLDNFKMINDDSSHLVGDGVLCDVVNIFKESIRTDDLIIRMGGDEFLLILKGLSQERLLYILNRIKEQFAFEFGQSFPFLSFSYGVSNFSNTIDSTLDKIDRDMYKQKKKKKESGSTARLSTLPEGSFDI